MKILSLFILSLLFIIPIVSGVGQTAKTDYNESGNSDGLYQLGLGGFNSALDPDTVNNLQTTSVTVTDGRKIPLVSDLDGDGFTEVIILDGRNIEIYQNKSLTFVTSFTLGTASDTRFSNMITFDIDDDGLREIIIVAEEERELHILEYNRSILINQTAFQGIDLSSIGLIGGIESGEVVIKCSSPERCLMVYSSALDTGFTPGFTQTNTFFGQFFNSSQESISSSFRTALDTSSGFSVFCQPNIRHMMAVDYDLDDPTNDPAKFEFIASNLEVELSSTTDEVANIYWIDILPNRSVVLDDNGGINPVTSDRVNDIFGTTSTDNRFTCDNSAGFNVNVDGVGHPLFAGFYITSPLVFNAENSAGLETIIGIGKDPDEFLMLMFEKDGSFIDRFPATILGDSEGIMISNVFKADIFDDSTQDFCIMGFNGDPIGSIDDSISVTCASKIDPNGFGFPSVESLEFRFDKVNLFNISQTYDQNSILAHSAEMNTENNVDEIVSAYGVLELDLDSCGIFGDCDMDLVFPQRKTANSPRVISTDAFDKFGLEDLIILTDLNLFYLDDGFSNQPANVFCGEPTSITSTCSQFTINPCVKSTWKINTSVKITITPKDPEGNLLSVRARLYAGDTNEFDSGFINVSSGQEFEISGGTFIGNKSGGGFNIILEAVDIVENPDTIRTVTKQFSVAENGVETFDCTTTGDTGVEEITPTVVIFNASLTQDATDNSIITGVTTFIGLTGLAGTTIWLILMIAFSIGIFFRASDIGWSGNSALGAVAIVNALFIILGARLGILSTGLVIIISVLGVVLIGVFLGKFITGVSTNNG